ncbi:unnamed protein product [Protopolystoma xenopodis]|uniref:Uncharacterized protein n=1 Tax=Protopolystoma xenopodis TaxID=117903 RepID=A0A3S5ALA9_9PLAT|nr:unnamed protein product [Protopolystoma xenopodis]
MLSSRLRRYKVCFLRPDGADDEAKARLRAFEARLSEVKRIQFDWPQLLRLEHLPLRTATSSPQQPEPVKTTFRLSRFCRFCSNAKPKVAERGRKRGKPIPPIPPNPSSLKVKGLSVSRLVWWTYARVDRERNQPRLPDHVATGIANLCRPESSAVNAG